MPNRCKYFVTICAYGGEPLFGEVIDGIMRLNRYGRIAQMCWLDLPRHYPHVVLDEFVVMPTHAHMITVLWPAIPVQVEPVNEGAPMGDQPAALTRHGLPEVVPAPSRHFPPNASTCCVARSGVPVWQRNYYEHIIRDDYALQAIRKYILDNPLRWHLDRYNPAAVGPDPEAAAIWRILDDL